MNNQNEMTDNYMKKVLWLTATLPPGSIADIHISHDDWCGTFRGRRCNCDPDIRIEPRFDASG